MREWKPKGNPRSCEMSKTDCMTRPRDGERKQKQPFPYSASFMLPRDKQPPQNTNHNLVCIQYRNHALTVGPVQDTRLSARCKEDELPLIKSHPERGQKNKARVGEINQEELSE